MLDGNFFFDTRVFLRNYRLLILFWGGWKILNFYFTIFVEEKHVPLSVCIIIQTPTHRFFCSTRVKQVKDVERLLSQYAHK
jgi:hypothetical protein